MNLLVRDVHLEDAEAIIGILNPIIEARVYTVLDSPLSLADEREFIEKFPARGIFQLAARREDHKILGFQSLEPLASYTHAFDHVGVIGTYVDLAFQRRGVAASLFTATFEAARRKGYEKIFTFVRADNPAGLGAYKKQGFNVIGTAKRQAKIDGAYIDEVMIERFL